MPAGRFIRALVHYYRVELHNFNPNSIMQAVVFVMVCEGYLEIPPHWYLLLHLVKAEMTSRNEGGEKRPLREDGCTLQLRQSRSHSYIQSIMPSSNRGWQNRWFYLRNDGGLLSEYTGKMVHECPTKWGWGAPAGEQKRLDVLLAGLEKLCHADVTAATVAVTFHKRSLLPLAQRVVPMWEMTRDTPWVGTWMLEVPVSVTEINTRVSRTISSDLKNYRVVPMRPDRDYISLVRHHLRLRFCLITMFFARVLIAICLQGMGVVRYALHPVPEDGEIRAQNRTRNEEQHR